MTICDVQSPVNQPVLGEAMIKGIGKMRCSACWNIGLAKHRQPHWPVWWNNLRRRVATYQRIIDAVAAHFGKQKAGPARPASFLKCLHQILYVDAKSDGPDNITR